MVLRLVEAYMERFEEELEQIQIKNSVGKHKNSNRSRSDAIRFVKEVHQKPCLNLGAKRGTFWKFVSCLDFGIGDRRNSIFA